jgi:choline dehydrogenase-like flavoprotein
MQRAVADPQTTPRGRNGRAPDVMRVGGWMPMRRYRENEPVDFAIVGTGAGGATLACRLAEHGFSVVAFDAGAWWRPLEEFASDEQHQQKLYWTDERLCDGDDPIVLGANNSGKAVGGSMVHFAMVSLRFRPEWFRSRSLLGYAVDWPIDWREMWHYYTEVEQTLNIAGPVNYPWGPKRPRYPYRAHELNAAALVMARGCDALGVPWVPTPLATLSAPHGLAHQCVYRGFCTVGCSTNAKQSTLVTWIPRAVRAGAEIRDLAMVGRIETNAAGLCTGVHYLREGEWRFQQARNVVVAGYAIETPRLLLMSANDRFPEGLANSSGLVGRNLMVQANQGVWACFDEEIRWYKGPPSLALTEHWNYRDTGKDFVGGYAYMSQGPLPQQWAATQTGNHGLWGAALLREMGKYIHQAGLKIVGEVLPQESNRVLSPMRRISTACPSRALLSPIATMTAAWCATPSTT